MKLKIIVVFAAGMLCQWAISRKFHVEPAPPVCPEPPVAKLPEKTARPSPRLAGPVILPRPRVPAPETTRVEPSRNIDGTPCPSNGAEYHSSHPAEDRLTCRCTAEAAVSGTVWGTGVYTADSSICRAARHDGWMNHESEEVTVYFRPGLAHYEGSENNGARSEDYGKWESSFAFSP